MSSWLPILPAPTPALLAVEHPREPQRHEPKRGNNNNNEDKQTLTTERISAIENKAVVSSDESSNSSVTPTIDRAVAKLPETRLVDVAPDDVVIGPWKHSNVHVGNIRLINQILSCYDEYEKMGKVKKAKLVLQIMRGVESRGGRFIRYEDGSWKQVDADTVRKKIALEFRKIRYGGGQETTADEYNPTVRPTKKADSDKRNNSSSGDGGNDHQEEGRQEDDIWVRCNRCENWRLVSPNFKMEVLRKLCSSCEPDIPNQAECAPPFPNQTECTPPSDLVKKEKFKKYLALQRGNNSQKHSAGIKQKLLEPIERKGNRLESNSSCEKGPVVPDETVSFVPSSKTIENKGASYIFPSETIESNLRRNGIDSNSGSSDDENSIDDNDESNTESSAEDNTTDDEDFICDSGDKGDSDNEDEKCSKKTTAHFGMNSSQRDRKRRFKKWENLPKGFCVYNAESGGEVQRVVTDHVEMKKTYDKVLNAFEKQINQEIMNIKNRDTMEMMSEVEVTKYANAENTKKTETEKEAKKDEALPAAARRSYRTRNRRSAEKDSEELVSLPYNYNGLDWDAIEMCWKPQKGNNKGNRRKNVTKSIKQVEEGKERKNAPKTEKQVQEGKKHKNATKTEKQGRKRKMDPRKIRKQQRPTSKAKIKAKKGEDEWKISSKALPTAAFRRWSSRTTRSSGKKPSEELVSLPYSYGSTLDWDAIEMCWKRKKPETSKKMRTI